MLARSQLACSVALKCTGPIVKTRSQHTLAHRTSRLTGIAAARMKTTIAKHVQQSTNDGLVAALDRSVEWALKGFTLLGENIGSSTRLIRKGLLGHPLNRRERVLIAQTLRDCLKLVPLLGFIVVPYAQMLVPFVAHKFPHTVPSTFRRVKSSVDGATLTPEATEILLTFNNAMCADNGDFFDALQEALVAEDDFPTPEDLIQYQNSYGAMRLGGMTAPQLRALAGMLNVKPSRISGFLRVQVRRQLTNIRRADRDYRWEGIDNLSKSELMKACRIRYILFHTVAESDMGAQLEKWVQLSSHVEIPTALLFWIQSVRLTKECTELLEKAQHHMVKASEEKLYSARDKLSELQYGIYEPVAQIEDAQYKLRDLAKDIDEAIEYWNACEQHGALVEDSYEDSQEDIHDSEPIPEPAPAAHTSDPKIEEEVSLSAHDLNAAFALRRRIAERQQQMLNHQLELMAAMRTNQEQEKWQAMNVERMQVQLEDITSSFMKDKSDLQGLLGDVEQVEHSSSSTQT